MRTVTVLDQEFAKRVDARLDQFSACIKQLQENVIRNNLDLADTMKEVERLYQLHQQGTGFIYIASPYTHQEENVRHDRYLQVMYYTMQLLQNKEWCYSPIVHCHEMARMHKLPTDAIFWMDYNYAMLSAARELHVLCLPGWNQSVGVKAEIAFWRHGKQSPVKFIERS